MCFCLKIVAALFEDYTLGMLCEKKTILKYEEDLSLSIHCLSTVLYVSNLTASSHAFRMVQ